MKYNRTQTVLLAVVLIVVWNLAALFAANQYYLGQVQDTVGQQTKLSNELASDLSDSIRRNLGFMAGIPDLLVQADRVKNALARFGTSGVPSPQPLAVRKKRWSDDRALRELSLYLRRVQDNLHVNLVYVVNAAGDCISAGNIDTPGSSIGSNYAERDFFRENRNGRPGMQYAVGKTTHIPGIFFAAPVMVKGRFVGAVVAKSEVPNLTAMIRQVSAFVTDRNGVIILANEKERELHALPGAPIEGVSEQDRFDRYRTTSFPSLQIEPWGDRRFASLFRVQGDTDPHIFSSKELPEYRMRVHIDTAVTGFHTLNRDRLWFAVLLGMAGSILILVASGTFLYVDSIKTAEAALKRASVAERRIIGIIEETQEKIGRELHDDLGQHLTGIAFISELLCQDLKKHGHSDHEAAARITTMINEAISMTRGLAQGLYPVELKGAGLHAMLEQVAFNVVSIYHIECNIVAESEIGIDNPQVLINLFRITQEAVNNAIKHSGATRITIRISETPASIELEIADNGRGIATGAADSSKGLGMHTMHYRASLLGAALRIAARPEGGTSVIVSLPRPG